MRSLSKLQLRQTQLLSLRHRLHLSSPTQAWSFNDGGPWASCSSHRAHWDFLVGHLSASVRYVLSLQASQAMPPVKYSLGRSNLQQVCTEVNSVSHADLGYTQTSIIPRDVCRLRLLFVYIYYYVLLLLHLTTPNNTEKVHNRRAGYHRQSISRSLSIRKDLV